jgi:hypothetical protein
MIRGITDDFCYLFFQQQTFILQDLDAGYLSAETTIKKIIEKESVQGFRTRFLSTEEKLTCRLCSNA